MQNNEVRAELDAQCAVIGALLIDPAPIAGELFAALREEDFSDAACRAVFCAAKRVFLSGEALNAVTILHALGGEENTYRPFFMQLMELTPTAADWQSYADIIREQAQLRRLKGLGVQLASAGTLQEAQELTDRLSTARSPAGNGRVHSLTDAVLEFYEEIDRRPDYLRWGIPGLDDGTLYAEQGDFIILGARPSVGKTALALRFAATIAQSKRVGFFSLETRTTKLVQRLVAAETGISFAKVKQRDLSDDDNVRIARANDRMSSSLHLRFVDAGGMTADDIRAVALSERFEVIFIDYLQIIHSRTRDPYQRVTQISIDLHTFAQQCGVTVIALSQLSRPEKLHTRDGLELVRAPRMSDLRESGQIEQDADIILMLNLTETENPYCDRDLRVVKNKEGLRKRLRLRFDGEHQTFREVALE